MQEAQSEKYFVDGFMIKHFNIWPSTIIKENLFPEQKIFLIYLMGIIPSHDDWQMNVGYQKELNKIKKIKNIELDKTDIDLAILQNRNIEEIRLERLKEYKNKKIEELDKKFGIKEDEEEKENPFNNFKDFENNNIEKEEKKLWDILNGKGLI